jgi:hypothetical protein
LARFEQVRTLLCSDVKRPFGQLKAGASRSAIASRHHSLTALINSANEFAFSIGLRGQ